MQSHTVTPWVSEPWWWCRHCVSVGIWRSRVRASHGAVTLNVTRTLGHITVTTNTACCSRLNEMFYPPIGGNCSVPAATYRYIHTDISLSLSLLCWCVTTWTSSCLKIMSTALTRSVNHAWRRSCHAHRSSCGKLRNSNWVITLRLYHLF